MRRPVRAQGFGKASGEVMAEIHEGMKAATSTAKLIDSFLAQRRKLIGCSKFREIAFVQARDLPFDYAT